MPILKRKALYSEVRQEVCPHMHFCYSGSVPCTGRLECSMCGYTPEDIQAIKSEEERSTDKP